MFNNILCLIGQILQTKNISIESNILLSFILLFLCSDNNGGFNDNISLPIECILGLMYIITTYSTMKTPIAVSNSQQSNNSDSNESSFNKKRRKMINKPVITSNQLISNANTSNSLLVAQIYEKFPALMNFLLEDSIDLANINENILRRLCYSIALTIFSRFLVMKSQNHNENSSNLAQQQQKLLELKDSITNQSSLNCENIQILQAIMLMNIDQINPSNEYDSVMTFLDYLVLQIIEIVRIHEIGRLKSLQMLSHCNRIHLFNLFNTIEALSFQCRENQVCSYYCSVCRNLVTVHLRGSICYIVMSVVQCESSIPA
jgi:hypothetical protein